jgi:DNA replication protein DnaC
VSAFDRCRHFDYNWPKSLDREQLDELFTLNWIHAATNVILVGPNGMGKSMIAQNLVHQAVINGATARFITASELLNDLASQD